MYLYLNIINIEAQVFLHHVNVSPENVLMHSEPMVLFVQEMAWYQVGTKSFF